MNELPSGTEAIQAYLSSAHATNANSLIKGPDQYGAFPDSLLHTSFRVESAPIAPDSSVLRNDVAQACRRGHHTILVSVANSGALRLFCAQYVIEEVSKNSEKWAA